MGQYYRENRIPVDYERISPHVVNALIATEDERFREHSGIDVRGTLRAAVYLGKKGGASTITQQLAKMLFTDRSPNFVKRTFQKFQEWIISARLERQYTKNEIIAMYLNRFDWINQAVGINSAARVYFNTTPDSLKHRGGRPARGHVQEPGALQPAAQTGHHAHPPHGGAGPDAQERLPHHCTEYDSLKSMPIGLRFQRVDHTEGPAPYFREVLRAKLVALFAEKNEDGSYRYAKADGTPYDIYTDGLKVYTTLDRRMQQYAEWGLQEHLRNELQARLLQGPGEEEEPALRLPRERGGDRGDPEHRDEAQRALQGAHGQTVRQLRAAGEIHRDQAARGPQTLPLPARPGWM
jgi:penicillin-binding protein 1A